MTHLLMIITIITLTACAEPPEKRIARTIMGKLYEQGALPRTEIEICTRECGE